jgi:hypothetical protein
LAYIHSLSDTECGIFELALSGKLTKKLVENLGAGRWALGVTAMAMACIWWLIHPAHGAGSCGWWSKARGIRKAHRCALTLVWVVRIS